MAAEAESHLEAHEIFSRLERAAYDQEYTYVIPGETENAVALSDAYRILIDRIGQSFRYTCQQATMYELMRASRSVHSRLYAGVELLLPSNERFCSTWPPMARSVWPARSPRRCRTCQATTITPRRPPSRPKNRIEIVFSTRRLVRSCRHRYQLPGRGQIGLMATIWNQLR